MSRLLTLTRPASCASLSSRAASPPSVLYLNEKGLSLNREKSSMKRLGSAKGRNASVASPTNGFSEVYDAAKEAIRTLRSLGVHSCAMGDLACRLLGNPRTPVDVELMVLSERMDEEQVKRRLVFHNPRFYTTASSDPTCKALFYRPPSPINSPLPPIPIYIHLPSTPTLPSLSSADITWHSGFPLAPLPLLLLSKLSLWHTHRHSPDPLLRRRQYFDQADLQAMLVIAGKRGVKMRSERCVSPGMVFEAGKVVREYMAIYPSTRTAWTKLDLLDTPPPLPPITTTRTLPPNPNPTPTPRALPAPPRQPPPRPATMMEKMRSKSPFLRKRASTASKVQQVQVRLPLASYMDWDD